ncbi:MAG: hypothetical protein EXS14_07050 [Planctomycetes bacterium]|nr:hypothetical protein [Planctomycetota bacterium]
MIAKTATMLTVLAFAAVSPTLPAQGFLHFMFGSENQGGFLQFAVPNASVHCCDSSCRRYEAGHWTYVTEQVRIPGACRKVWVAPVYRTEWTWCGNPVQILVCAGHFQKVRDPDRCQTVRRRVWQPARWIQTCNDC